MKKIPLTQGKFAIVDDRDYIVLSKHKWYAQGRTHYTTYAARAIPHPEKGWGSQLVIYMHRVIMATPNGLQTDHINHNGLDNRRCNLRSCSVYENQYNQRPRGRGVSRYRGVSRHSGKWYAQIRHARVRTYIGIFVEEVEAAKAYDAHAKVLHGKFACLNFPESEAPDENS